MGSKRPNEDHYEGGGKRAHYDQQPGVHPSRRGRFSDAPEDRDRDSNTYRPFYENRSKRKPRPVKQTQDALRRLDDPSHGPDSRRREHRNHKWRPLDTSQAASTAVNALKAKIRDLTRLLDRSESLPADVRIEKERALAGYKQDLDAAYKEKAKQALIKKYHMVRFFGSSSPCHSFPLPFPTNRITTNIETPVPTERQKATRALNKLTKLLPTTPAATPAHTDLQAQIHEAQVDLNYALYYPLLEKYTSLYPRTAAQGPVETSQDIGGRGERVVGCEKPPIWALVEKCMADGTLEALRDGKLGGGTLVLGRGRPKVEGAAKGNGVAGGSGKEVEKTKKSGGGVKLTGGAVSDDDGDEAMSDGGFFEE